MARRKKPSPKPLFVGVAGSGVVEVGGELREDLAKLKREIAASDRHNWPDKDRFRIY